ncbi:MAG TPA: hypothetical protein VGP95_05490 [Gemmatimonadaceae bacterium]|jgi:hypothetical protein|nr:hypothetical protein [Gemmatimonadaceae bacterium]
MNTRFGFLKLATFVAVAAATVAPAVSHAQQSNRGQLVQAVVKLNNAQLAFAKKLAEDTQFAAQFDKATGSGNYDAAASLAASVTGLPKSSISVTPGGAPGGDDNHAAANTAPTQSVYKLAAFSRPNESKLTSGKICFNLVVVAGCIGW